MRQACCLRVGSVRIARESGRGWRCWRGARPRPRRQLQWPSAAVAFRTAGGLAGQRAPATAGSLDGRRSPARAAASVGGEAGHGGQPRWASRHRTAGSLVGRAPGTAGSLAGRRALATAGSLDGRRAPARTAASVGGEAGHSGQPRWAARARTAGSLVGQRAPGKAGSLAGRRAPAAGILSGRRAPAAGSLAERRAPARRAPSMGGESPRRVAWLGGATPSGGHPHLGARLRRYGCGGSLGALRQRPNAGATGG